MSRLRNEYVADFGEVEEYEMTDKQKAIRDARMHLYDCRLGSQEWYEAEDELRALREEC